MGILMLKCSNCNGNLELDKDKVFGHCIHCGTKIKIREHTSIHTSIKVDTSKQIGNFMTAAKTAILQEKYDVAVRYTKQTLKLDESVLDAWLLQADASNMLNLKRSGEAPLNTVLQSTRDLLSKYNLYSKTKMDVEGYFKRFLSGYKIDYIRMYRDLLIEFASKIPADKSKYNSNISNISNCFPNSLHLFKDDLMDVISNAKPYDKLDKLILLRTFPAVGSDEPSRILEGIHEEYASDYRGRIKDVLYEFSRLETEPLSPEKIENLKRLTEQCTVDGPAFYYFYAEPINEYLKHLLNRGLFNPARDVVFHGGPDMVKILEVDASEWNDIKIALFSHSFKNAKRHALLRRWNRASSEIEYSEKLYPGSIDVQNLARKIRQRI